jgi:acyl-CoA thioester hydrolase
VTPESLASYPVIVEVPVLWSDEDSFGHVNNVAYLRWCEQGRVEYLGKIGLMPSRPPKGIGPIVASVTCNYRAQMTYPDTVIVGTRVSKVGNSSFKFEQRLVSRATGAVVAEAEATIVTIDYAAGASVRVPDAVREAIGRVSEVTASR